MRLFDYSTIDSTNSQARRLQVDYPGEPLLVVAQEQTAGRGRMGRSWVSPRGGAWFTVTWPLAAEAGHSLMVAPVVAGLVAAEAIDAAVAEASAGQRLVRVAIKWPNDLLLDGMKIAGILCERWPAMDDQQGDVLAIGIGINANVPKSAFTAIDAREAQGKPRAASIIEQTGVEVCPMKLARQIAHDLSGSLKSINGQEMSVEMTRSIESRLAWMGESVTLATGPRIEKGRLAGIERTGRLILSLPDGSVVKREAGELVVADQAGYNP